MLDLHLMATRSRSAAWTLAASSLEERNATLLLMAEELNARRDLIFAANEADMAAAEKDQLAAPLLGRLKFREEKLHAVTEGLRALATLPDPIGQTTLARELTEGLDLYRVTCPIGVIGVIFESRPDALVQIACLCLKSGNATLLKGGSEALETNRTLFEVLMNASLAAGLPQGWAGLMETREDVNAMLGLDAYIDLIIPRGSNAFVRYIKEHSRIPVLGHADGICHVYVDRSCDLDMAVRVAVDAKTQYVAVCNACETLLVHAAVAQEYLPRLKAAMEEKHTRLLGCARTQAIIDCEAAQESDWSTEYLDYVLSVKIVDSLEEAITHINRYGSGHTDAIITRDEQAARTFTTLVDSAGVYVNCSTRFADGFRYGFGAEVGIATGKVHARGPMGLEGLCIYKYKLLGCGQIVEDFESGKAHFTHRPLIKDCPM